MQQDDIIAAAVARLRLRFLEGANAQSDQLRQLIAQVSGNQMSAVSDIQKIAHRIGGTTGTLGLATLSQVALECESEILSQSEHGAMDITRILSAAQALVDELDRSVA